MRAIQRAGNLKRFIQIFSIALLLALPLPMARAETVISASQTARLIRNAKSTVLDPQGWAIDLHDVLQSNDLPQSKENICAAIAVIAQESGFVADPFVPGLGKLSEKALREKFGKVPIGGTVALQVARKQPNTTSQLHAAHSQCQN